MTTTQMIQMLRIESIDLRDSVSTTEYGLGPILLYDRHTQKYLSVLRNKSIIRTTLGALNFKYVSLLLGTLPNMKADSFPFSWANKELPF